MNVAILGVGTVGKQVAQILMQNQKIISARSGHDIRPVIGLVRDLSKKRDIDLPLTDDLQSIIKRDDIDIFVELMGGTQIPYQILSEILKRKKAVVTANKALLAYHRYDLQKIAGNTPFGFEASVAGGIPIIKTLKEGLSANNIYSIKGIMNGTSNYILSSMMQEAVSFNEALAKAQKLGYAEFDPYFDISGYDAAHKLLILASIAYGVDARPEDILIEGIDKINKKDIFFMNEFNYTIKLLGIAKKIDNEIELRVHGAIVPKDNMIAKVDGVMNAISVVGDAVGETMFYGAGAGGNATASSVISDLVDIARGLKSPMLGYKTPLSLNPVQLLKKDHIKTKYYFRLQVEDKVGVLAKITNIMSENNLSIDTFLQNSSSGDGSTLFFTTHLSQEINVKNVLKLLNNEKFILKDPFMLRIEE